MTVEVLLTPVARVYTQTTVQCRFLEVVDVYRTVNVKVKLKGSGW